MRQYLVILSLALLNLTALAENKVATIEAGNSPVLKLEVPKDAKVTTKGAKTTLLLKETYAYIWHVPGAHSIADAVPQVPTIIKSEFTNFKVGDSKHLKVAGQDADHLFGKGEEADDGDPGAAEVVVFSVGKQVFVGCVHGEKDEAAKRSPSLLAVLKTVQVP
jgi:hypothetical protein